MIEITADDLKLYARLNLDSTARGIAYASDSHVRVCLHNHVKFLQEAKILERYGYENNSNNNSSNIA